MAVYSYQWRNKWLTAQARSLEEMVGMLRAAADELDAMRAAGVALQPDSGVADDYATLTTEDPAVAQRFGFIEEDEQDAEGEPGPG